MWQLKELDKVIDSGFERDTIDLIKDLKDTNLTGDQKRILRKFVYLTHDKLIKGD